MQKLLTYQVNMKNSTFVEMDPYLIYSPITSFSCMISERNIPRPMHDKIDSSILSWSHVLFKVIVISIYLYSRIFDRHNAEKFLQTQCALFKKMYKQFSYYIYNQLLVIRVSFRVSQFPSYESVFRFMLIPLNDILKGPRLMRLQSIYLCMPATTDCVNWKPHSIF